MLKNVPLKNDNKTIIESFDATQLTSKVNPNLNVFPPQSLINKYNKNKKVDENFENDEEISDFKFVYSDSIKSFFISSIRSDQDDKNIEKVLEAEGCPICLFGSILDKQPDKCIIATCRMINCFHVFHSRCVKKQKKLKVDNKEPQFKLENYHSSNFLEVRSFYDPDIVNENTPLVSNEYYITLEISHILSNATSMRIDWPEPINSYIDTVSQNEFLLLSLDRFVIGEKFIESEQSENLPMFRAKRGKILFSCTEKRSGRSWKIQTNYDIYFNNDQFVFFHIDNDSQNILTLGVQCEQVNENMKAYTLLFVKYEISNESSTPMIQMTPLTGSAYSQIPTEYPMVSPLSNEVSPFFVQGNLMSPFPPIATLYKLEDSALIDLIDRSPKEDPFDKNFQKYNKKISSDFIPVKLPENSFFLPSSTSKSIFSPVNKLNNVQNKILNNESNDYLGSSQKNEFKLKGKYLKKESTQNNFKLGEKKQSYVSSKSSKKKRSNKNNESDKLKKPSKEKQCQSSTIFYNISIGSPINKPISKILKILNKQLFNLSKTQYGSRFIQMNLEKPEHFNIIFSNLKNHTNEMIIDNFGHYSFEAMFSLSSEEKKVELLQKIAKNPELVACHKQGSFSIQSMMESIMSDGLVRFFGEILSKKLLTISSNCSGHYVILRYISRFGFPYSKFISDSVEKNIEKYCTDHYGLRVVKTVLELGSKTSIDKIYYSIVKKAKKLVKDQFGNYIVQHVFEFCPNEINDLLNKELDQNFVSYSKQKFSSNVVEKALRFSSSFWISKIIRQLISVPSDLINDKYGNYCLQTALNVCDKKLTIEFANSVTPHLSRLRENVKNKWINLIENAKLKHKI